VVTSAPLELGGEWGGSPPNDAFAVISRMREACLSGVRLLSDRQPERLRVDHTSGLPHIWLHEERPDAAWIVVDIGALDWCVLSYQFGHELGHVLCNSWQPQSKPKLPSQWLEEALVEAFAIRGLGLLADSWEQHPPFPNDAAFANSIRKIPTRSDREIPNAGGRAAPARLVRLAAQKPGCSRPHGRGRDNRRPGDRAHRGRVRRR
jgi:hypothetical protein